MWFMMRVVVLFNLRVSLQQMVTENFEVHLKCCCYIYQMHLTVATGTKNVFQGEERGLGCKEVKNILNIIYTQC